MGEQKLANNDSIIRSLEPKLKFSKSHYHMNYVKPSSSCIVFGFRALPNMPRMFLGRHVMFAWRLQFQYTNCVQKNGQLCVNACVACEPNNCRAINRYHF